VSINTTNEIAGPVNVQFQTGLLRRAKALLPHFLGSTPATITSHQNTFTAKWRRYEHLTPTTTPLAEITGAVTFPTRTGVQASVTDLTATVQKFGNFMFLGEEVDLINISKQGMELAEILGENAGRSLNRLQRNELEDNTTALFGGTATTATGVGGAVAAGVVSRTNLANVVNTLNRNDARKFLAMTTGSQNVGTAPVRESYWGINHPDVTEDIRLLAGFTSVESYAGQTETAQGEYGHVGGIRFVESTECSIDAAAGQTTTGSATIDTRGSSNRADIYNNIILGRDAHGSLGLDAQHLQEIYRTGDTLPAVMMISHPKGSAGPADPYNEVSSVAWKSWHAAKILDGTWVRNLRSAASKLTAA
jgi:N4-gp56 family major capsid protein